MKMNLKEQLLKQVEESTSLKPNTKASTKNSIKLATEVYGINLEEVTVDEKTALAQKEIIEKKQKEIGKGDVSNIYGVVRRAFEYVHGYSLPFKYDETTLHWSTGNNMELLADCVVEMILKYNDKSLLVKLDGFNKNHEKNEEKFSDLVNSIIIKLNIDENKRAAIYPQLSTIGCAYKGYKNYNNDLCEKYKKIIDAKLAKAFIEGIEFDKNENIEEELNIEVALYEGSQQTRTITVRQRNSNARKIVLERDNYTCQCCGLTPIDLFKNTLHVHHNNPLHKSKGTRKVTINELVTLCPTCHGYIHYKKEELTVEDVQLILKNNS